MSAHIPHAPTMDLHNKDSEGSTVPDPPPDSEESDEESDDSLDVPDTVDPPTQVVHPLLKPKHRPYKMNVS